MLTPPIQRPMHDPLGRRPVRMAMPVAAAVAGTVVGAAVAAAVHRSGAIEPDAFEFVPDGGTRSRAGGDASVSRRPQATGCADGWDDERLADAAAALATTGICPTFDVAAELAREIETEPSSQPGPRRPVEPALSAPRA